MSLPAPQVGLASHRPAFAGAMLASLSYGIYLTLTAISLYFLFFRRGRSMALVSYTLLLFLSTSLFWVSEWIWAQNLPSTSNTVQWKQVGLKDADWYHVARAASLLATVTLTEGLMMWRCLVVWDNAIFILVLPALLFIASLVLSILLLCGIGAWEAAAISTLVLGGVLTLLIAGRMVWRRLRLLAALVESSALYTVASIALVALLFVAGDDAVAIASPFLAMTMSIAPMLVVLRIALGRDDSLHVPEALTGARHASSASFASLYPNQKRPYSTTLTMTGPGGMNPVLLAQLRRGTSASGSTYRDSL
ncbi:hypothetical protein AURDEDRAFT_182960 [Auricularia subglabra TFB-10046 SS5]|nr:hypothetical protein AURDEDRAFT_182960 [Auricularia subglabra TFB-10046 SS5]